MASITESIVIPLVLDVIANPIKSISVKQFNQYTYKLVVTFTANGLLYSINKDNEMAYLKVITPVGNHCLYEGTIDDNGTVTFTLPQQLSWSAGRGKANVDIYDKETGTKRVPSLVFDVVVEESAYDDGVVVESEDFKIFANYIAQMTNKVDKEDGKGLSTNDFSDYYKTKLDELISQMQ